MGKNYGRYKKGLLMDYRVIPIRNGFLLRAGLAVDGGTYYPDIDSLIVDLKKNFEPKEEDEKEIANG